MFKIEDIVNKIHCADCMDFVKQMPSNSISGLLCDPPYGLGFMGKEWDTFKQENVNLPKATKLTYKMDYINGIPVRRKNPEIVTRDSGARRAGSYDLSRNPEFQQWFTVWAKTMLRITKPGGFLLCFGGTRTVHRLTCAIEDAGWEIRDCMMWLYGSGFPKSHNIGKAIDKAAGAKRKIVGTLPAGSGPLKTGHVNRSGGGLSIGTERSPEINITVPTTTLAQLWDGYGTALKPAWEPIIVAMKPLDGTFAHNAEAHGVAGLNIDGGRIHHSDPQKFTVRNNKMFLGQMDNTNTNASANPQGRWPANLILDEEAGAMLDEQTGILQSGDAPKKRKAAIFKNCYGAFQGNPICPDARAGNSGGASRFFYCAKTSKRERNMGLEDQSGKKVNDGRETPIDNPYQRGETIRLNTHPTVKPLALMKYLCTLLKMPSADQIILDPFLGSGTTGIACKELGINFIGIEKEPEYCEIAVKRIAAVKGQEITLHADPPLPVTKNMVVNKQKIIDAAAAALKEKRK